MKILLINRGLGGPTFSDFDPPRLGDLIFVGEDSSWNRYKMIWMNLIAEVCTMEQLVLHFCYKVMY